MPTPNRRPAAALMPLSGVSRRRLSACLFSLCLAGIVLGALSTGGRRQTSEDLPDGGVRRVLALQRARLLYQTLAPGEPPPLAVMRSNNARAAREGSGRIPAREEWVVEHQDGSATDAFIVAYDAATGAFKRLSWEAPARVNAPQGARRASTDQQVEQVDGEATGRDLLNPERAVEVTCRLLRRLGIPGADGPWAVVSAQRRLLSVRSATGKEWRVTLVSRRWQVKSCLDATTIQVLQLAIDPAEPAGPAESVSRSREDQERRPRAGARGGHGHGGGVDREGRDITWCGSARCEFRAWGRSDGGASARPPQPDAGRRTCLALPCLRRS